MGKKKVYNGVTVSRDLPTLFSFLKYSISHRYISFRYISFFFIYLFIVIPGPFEIEAGKNLLGCSSDGISHGSTIVPHAPFGNCSELCSN